jgi:hypothetical protein
MERHDTWRAILLPASGRADPARLPVRLQLRYRPGWLEYSCILAGWRHGPSGRRVLSRGQRLSFARGRGS